MFLLHKPEIYPQHEPIYSELATRRPIAIVRSRICSRRTILDTKCIWWGVLVSNVWLGEVRGVAWFMVEYDG